MGDNDPTAAGDEGALPGGKMPSLAKFDGEEDNKGETRGTTDVSLDLS